jgi:hypothetical protein
MRGRDACDAEMHAIPYMDRGCHTCKEDIIHVYKHHTRIDDIGDACEAEMPAMQRCMRYHTWIEDVIHVKKISYMYINITHA